MSSSGMPSTAPGFCLNQLQHVADFVGAVDLRLRSQTCSTKVDPGLGMPVIRMASLPAIGSGDGGMACANASWIAFTNPCYSAAFHCTRMFTVATRSLPGERRTRVRVTLVFQCLRQR